MVSPPKVRPPPTTPFTWTCADAAALKPSKTATHTRLLRIIWIIPPKAPGARTTRAPLAPGDCAADPKRVSGRLLCRSLLGRRLGRRRLGRARLELEAHLAFLLVEREEGLELAPRLVGDEVLQQV